MVNDKLLMVNVKTKVTLRKKLNSSNLMKCATPLMPNYVPMPVNKKTVNVDNNLPDIYH